MTSPDSERRVPVERLRWRLDPASLPFETTAEIEPLAEIIGQPRGVASLRFGMGLSRPGYNIFVTGAPGSGRMSTVKKILDEFSKTNQAPDDLCYVNNFKDSEAPILLRFTAGQGSAFKKDVHDFIETLKREVPQLFESQEYINRKNEIMEAYEKKSRDFFKALEKKVTDTGFALVQVQAGPFQRPELMPIVDGEPTPLPKLEELAEKGRFPKEELEQLKAKYATLKQEIDQIFLEIRDLQREVRDKQAEVDKLTFTNMAEQRLAALLDRYKGEQVAKFLKDMVADMVEDLRIFQTPATPPGMPPGMVMPAGDAFQPYQVNLLVDNAEQKGPPVIIESFPNYRNLFGSIERVVDRSGVWRTDFSKIKAGSFVKANGGFLVVNLMDALMEPGVWPALKRALKAEQMEIQTFDPFSWFTSTGIRPEPIDLRVKVVLLSDAYVYYLLRAYDEDMPKIFKVRADFDRSMDKTEGSIGQFAAFIRKRCEEDGLKSFDRSGVAAMIEEAVRATGRQEKISTAFPGLSDILREADYFAAEAKSEAVTKAHVDKAIEARIFRSNLIEEKIQEMISRGSLFIDTGGAVAGQVNGLAVMGLPDYMFGIPSRITASVSLGKEGVINIEREADMSGRIHNKGVLILSGLLREKFAQDKPLTVSASIAFEQSYSGVDGDSASSTEAYALLSALSGVPIRQAIAVTGSINQKGQIQPIGGVNEKIEGFYAVCKAAGLSGEQGVMIPESNVKDLMLRDEVVKAVTDGKFAIYAARTVDEGIEILTGKPAGERRADGSYPEDSIYGLADKRLHELAETMAKFGKPEEKDEEKAPAKPDEKPGKQTD